MGIDFHVIIAIVFGVGAAIAVGSLLLVVQVVMMRRWRVAEERRRKAFEAAWEPIVDGEVPEPEELPRVGKRDLEEFVMMMNDAQVRTALREDDEAADARERLAAIVRRLKLEPAVLRLVQKGSVEDQLVGITMLGYLGDAAVLPTLKTMAESPNPVLSIAAAHARLQIDPTAARDFLEMRLRRSDWPPAKVDAIVEQEGKTLEPAVLDAVFTLPEGDRLVRYLAYCDPVRALDAVRRILEAPGNAATIAAALKVLAKLGAHDDADRAARYVRHEDWRVRVQAANALGSSHDAAQIAALVPLLADREWWVRYRAAQAIAQLGTPESVQEVRAAQEDRFAREMLSHVMAERELERHRKIGKVA